ncbi:MAG: lipid A deacylase LpxR family protein [Gemmatimonas sp.]
MRVIFVQRAAALAAALFILGLQSANGAAAEDDGWLHRNCNTFTAEIENDLVQHSDRHYTHGTRFTCTQRDGSAPESASDSAAALGLFADGGHRRLALTLGQNIYTPNNLAAEDAPLTDRPYAGWLYGGVGMTSDTGVRYDALELDLGIVGPQAYAKETQRLFHGIPAVHARTKRPAGWSHQLKNEPGVVATYDHVWRAVSEPVPLGLRAEILPQGGAAVGNVFTHAEGGAMIRIGRNIPADDYGPPLIRPSAPGSSPAGADGFGWYVFAAAQERAVARNIFLDGNTFAHSRSVDKNTWVGDLSWGVVFTWDWARLALVEVYRTREFEGQEHPDSYGAMTLGIRF